MVALTDVELSKALNTSANRAPSRTRRRKRTVAGLARFAGVVLMLAAVGIWIVSGPLVDSGMLALRLAVSVFFMCTGLMLLQVGRGSPRDESIWIARPGPCVMCSAGAMVLPAPVTRYLWTRWGRWRLRMIR